MFKVYVIQSKSTGKTYIGQTDDLQKLLRRHNKELPYSSKSYTAKNVGPWKLVYNETFKKRAEAVKREQFLKSHVGRNFVSDKIKGV